MFQNFATKITVYREKLLVESCLSRGISSGESYPLESSEERVSRDPLRVVDTRKKSYKTIFPEIFPDKTDDLRLDGFEGRIDENERVTEFRLI